MKVLSYSVGSHFEKVVRETGEGEGVHKQVLLVGTVNKVLALNRGLTLVDHILG